MVIEVIKAGVCLTVSKKYYQTSLDVKQNNAIGITVIQKIFQVTFNTELIKSLNTSKTE